MPTDSLQQFTPSNSPRRIGQFWPAFAIIGLGLAVIGYLQIVRVVDNGTSNGFTDIAALVTLILLGLWTAFFSPFSRSSRWRIVLAAAALLVAALSVVRIDGFDGNLKAHLAWRWTPKSDVALASKPLDDAVKAIDVQPTSHDF